MFTTLREDFRRNTDPLTRAVLIVFRFGQWTTGPGLARRLATIPYKVCNLLLLRLGTGSDLPRTVICGPGLRLYHPYGIIIHPAAVLGARVRLYHRVTIGRLEHPGEPRIGDDVLIGAGATVLGPVTIGDHAKIGAGAIVVIDVPDGGIAVAPCAELRHLG